MDFRSQHLKRQKLLELGPVKVSSCKSSGGNQPSSKLIIQLELGLITGDEQLRVLMKFLRNKHVGQRAKQRRQDYLQKLNFNSKEK